MKAIFGLGNVGIRYKNNRHNVGFHFIDFVSLFYADQILSERERFDGVIREMIVDSEKILFVKPATLMNRSGDCVKKVVDFYKIPLEGVFIVHDDLDIKLGGYKLQHGKGPHMHNGVNDVSQKLGTSDYLRLRIGIENRDDKVIPGSAYVLSDFTKEESKELRKVFRQALDEILIKYLCEGSK